MPEVIPLKVENGTFLSQLQDGDTIPSSMLPAMEAAIDVVRVNDNVGAITKGQPV